MIAKYLIVVVILPVSLVICDNCDDASARKLDNIVAKVVTLGNSGRKFPENKPELKKYCE